MPKRTTTFSLALPPPDGKTPSYRWLYSAIRAQILSGRLPPGMRLPSSRELAKLFSLSRGTILAAFDQLTAEGYLEGIVGSGTRVSSTLPEDWLNVENFTKAGKRRIPPKRHVSRFAKSAVLFPGYDKRPTRAFRSNVPALDQFPMELWTQVVTRVLRRASTQHLLGCAPMGYEPLQRAVAQYLAASRGVNCLPQQIAIISGIQEALDITARVFIDRGDSICMEGPGYIGASQAFEAAGALILQTGLDAEGMMLPRRGTASVRLVYVTPGHQFPLGITMSLARRLALLEWASALGVLIFEDDYDGEFRYTGRPIPSLQGLDRSGCVLYAGSFSKVLFPSLRLAYLVVPPDLVERFAATISLTTRHAPVLEQAALAEFIDAGHFARHIRRMREVYAERLEALVDGARREWKGLLELSPIEAGLQTVAWLPKGISESAAVDAAERRNVDVTPLSAYCRKPWPRQGLQLGFAGVNAREIRRGVRDLAAALASLAPA